MHYYDSSSEGSPVPTIQKSPMDHLPDTLVIYAVADLLSTQLRNKFQDGHHERKSFGN